MIFHYVCCGLGHRTNHKKPPSNSTSQTRLSYKPHLEIWQPPLNLPVYAFSLNPHLGFPLLFLLTSILFRLAKSRYDQSTYLGRLKHFVGLTNPSTLFVSRQGLERAKETIANYNAGKLKDVNPEELWRAKQIVDSTVHPDTGEPVFLPFRMSCFVPTNMVVVAGMLMPNPSMKSIIFWQWANQSINVAINYANANKTTEMSIQETSIAYVSAVTTSCLIAVGLTQSVPRLRGVSPAFKGLLMRLVPFVAVAAAGTVNVFLMRGKEIRDGIDVFDADGNLVGKSKVAGKAAVTQVAISRILTNAPVMVIPPLLLAQFQKTRLLARYPQLTLPINFGLIGISIMTALPMAIAVFPQRGALETRMMEERFRSMVDAHGRPVEALYYNKGL
ncbi:LOW QUALITY PROTEIN: Tricarboxylate/iron carrier [Jimgerdemannia flammicorona]|uniref:Sidoreflexin n=1 Tax=Jimgerdemannia flammicorona TaxID=994334 RepID=A0A433Q442_9FUNG|nr:LOW QUALITY PROTEIN: Tricarboxylate/iron carrier [Jimgerdemannia flammicorona]